MLNALINRAGGGFDRAVTRGVSLRLRRGRSSAESLGPAERVARLAAIEREYDRPEFFADPDALFGPVTAPAVTETHVRAHAPRGRVVDVAWPSAFAPIVSDASVAARYLACEANRSAAARLFLHDDKPRPAAILVHGYLVGRFSFEERIWPIAWLASRGFDVALAVLPFHGVRQDPARSVPLFPGADPRITIEGFRQSIADLRSLAAWFRARGAPAVGMMGMSLGGYTTALYATVDPALAFAVPLIPLASIADFARETGRLVGAPEERAAQHAALERAHRVVSPLARPSLVAKRRAVVLAAEGDAVTPIAHARRLAEHLNAPLETFPGGHLLQIGRGRAFRAVGRMLGELGLLEP